MSLIAALGVTLVDFVPKSQQTKVFMYDHSTIRISNRLCVAMHALATERNISFHQVARELIQEIQAQ